MHTRTMTNARLRPTGRIFALLLLTLSTLTAPAIAQDGNISALRDAIFRSFERSEHSRCVELLTEYLAARPNDVQMWYNLACAHALLGERDSGARALRRAVQAGFADFAHMEHDPDLDALRDHPTYQKILTDERPQRRRDADHVIGLWKNRFIGDDYRYETHEAYRLAYATTLDATAHREMQVMLEAEADWLIENLFNAPPDYFVLIAIPTKRHADELFDGDQTIGGLYDHNQRVLVSRDIGGSMRHEFFHLMHYGHMERIGQRHPLWIQEGLASLFEDYQLKADGSIIFKPNERHNVVKRREKAGRVMRWSQLFGLTESRFMRNAGAMYPQVRSMFEFVADKGHLKTWYARYVENFHRDKSGRVAFEEVFAAPLDDIERMWRNWVRARPMVDNVIGYGDASLGIESPRHGASDGVVVSGIIPGGAASRSRLRSNDVIVAADGEPTRTLTELQAIIGAKRVDDRVSLRVRRGSEYLTIVVRLAPLRPGRE